MTHRLTFRMLRQKYEEVEDKRLKKGTWKNYSTTFAYLEAFLKKEIPSGDIRVDKLTREFLTSFKTYIPTHPIKEGSVCQGNGLAKHIERTMRMVNWAVDEELLARPPVGSYKVKKKKPKKIFLDEEELARMDAQVFLDEEVAYVHELAIFAC